MTNRIIKSITCIATLSIICLSCNRSDDGIRPQTKTLIEAVYASGFIVSRDEYQVFAQAEGYIAEKLVNDGDLVKKGEALYIIASEQQSAKTSVSKEAYQLAYTNYQDDSPVLSELRAAVDASLTKLKYDSVNFVRFSNLLQRNATSQHEYDRAKLAYENSKNEYVLQKSRYTRTKNQLYLDLQNAKSQLTISSNESGRYTLRSEVDGMIFMTAKEKSELIHRGELIAIIGDNQSYYLELNVDELDIQRIRVGQSVVVRIDAYPDKTFEAEITKVYPLVDRRQQSVRVDAALKQSLPGLFSGLALEANIIIRKKDQALVIPKSKLLPGDSVFIKTPEGTKKIKVVKGIETLDEVEIIEGLDTGNLIVNQ